MKDHRRTLIVEKMMMMILIELFMEKVEQNKMINFLAVKRDGRHLRTAVAVTEERASKQVWQRERRRKREEEEDMKIIDALCVRSRSTACGCSSCSSRRLE